MELFDTIFAGFAVFVALRALSHTRDKNSLQAVTHCTSRYSAIMAEAKNASSESFDEDDWYYRFFVLQADQYILFKNKWIILDFYQLWMAEFACSYDKKPTEYFKKTRREAHQKHLMENCVAFSEDTKFFKEFGKLIQRKLDPTHPDAAADEDLRYNSLRIAVYKLVDERAKLYAEQNKSWFSRLLSFGRRN